MANPSTLNTANWASTNNAAAFPTYVDARGVTTIVWGTEGRMSGYIVTSCNQSARVEEIDIEQGSGFEAVVILLRKGYDLDIEVIDDLSVTTPPVVGDVVTMSSPWGSIAMLMVGDKGNQARKREGMRTFTFKSYTAISLA